MASISVYDLKKSVVGEIELNDSVFNAEIKEYLIHEALKIQLANRRAGTVAVKNRSAVSGSGKKPFKQKGTGNARQGCKRAPQYPGGGVAFGPQQKTYDLAMNKKARKAALRSVLSLLVKENNFTVLDSLDIEKVSTKYFATVLNLFEAPKALIISETHNDNLELSARNIKNVKVIGPSSINPYDIMKYKRIILTRDAAKLLEGALEP